MLYCTVLYCTTLYYTVLYTVTRWFNEGDQYPDTDNTAVYRWVYVEFLNITIVMIMSRAEVCGGHGPLRPAGVGRHGGGGLRHGDAPHGREAGQVGTPSLVPANCGHGAGTTPATTGPWSTISASLSTHQVPGNNRTLLVISSSRGVDILIPHIHEEL